MVLSLKKHLWTLVLFVSVSNAYAYDANKIKQSTIDSATMFSFREYVLAASSHLENGQYDSTILCLKVGLKTYPPDDSTSYNTQLQKVTLILMTHSFKALAIRDSALFYARKVIDFAKKTNDKSLEANYLYTLATIYAEHNNGILAIEYYLKSAQIAEEISDFLTAATSYGGASIYSTNKKNAIKWAEMAVECARQSEDKADVAGKLLFAAAAYYNNENFEKSADCYRQSMKYFQEVQDSNGYKMANSGLMFLLNKIGEQDSAWVAMNSTQAKVELGYNKDSLALPNSMQGVKLDLLTSEMKSGQKALEFDILSREYLQQQADSLRTKIWLLTISSVLVILLLVLLSGRQRLKLRAKARYIEGLESERKRISKELHDGVCNDLLAMEMALKNSNTSMDVNLLEKVRKEVRMLSHELMPPAFQYAALDEILLDFVTNLGQTQSINITFSCTPDVSWDAIESALAFQLYRIVQEAVNNSIKHSAANEITVELFKVHKHIKLVVNDNGRGFDLETDTPGIGLQTIKERAKSIGAQIAIRSSSAGTLIELTRKING